MDPSFEDCYYVISRALLFWQDHHHPPQHNIQGVPISWSPLGQYSPFWGSSPKTRPAPLPDLHSPCDTSTVPPAAQHSSTVFLPLFQLYFHFSLGQHLFTELSLVWLNLASPPTSPTKFSWTISLSQSPDFCQISRISTGICFRLGLILATRQTLSENIIFFVSGLDEQISRLSE